MSFLFKKVAATDAAEFRIVHAKGVGKWWVEPNVSMFGGEWGNGRKEFATREEAEKYAKGTGKTYIVRDECEGKDAAEFKVGDKVKHTQYGTIGKVFEIDPAGNVGVQWNNGQAYYGKTAKPISLIIAADSAAQFKVGDKIWVDPSYGANLNIGYGWNVGIVKRVSMGNIDVDFKGQVISVPAPYCARVNSSGKPVFDSAAQDAITESDLKKHAHDFARYELGKYADELRKKRNSLANLWEKTSIAGGAIRSGEYKQADIDEFIDPYVNAIDDAIRILERI